MKSRFSLPKILFKPLSISFFIILCSCSKTDLQETASLKTGNQENEIKNAPASPTAFCLTPLYRYWNIFNTDHFYTITSGNFPGWSFERIECQLLTCPQIGFIPFHRYWNASRGDHFYTTIPGNYSGYVYEGFEGYISPNPNPLPSEVTLVPLYRYFNNAIVDHFYTVTPGNYSAFNYVYEGIAGYVFP
jgi:hypothetical protein